MADVSEAEKSMVRNLEEKTGKTFEQWIGIARKEKAEKHGTLVTALKKKHGLTHGYANLVAHKAHGTDAGSTSDSAGLVDLQYAGKKQSLREIYDLLLAKVAGFGPDVEVAPKKTYVSLRRSKQFALIQPSTSTRVDVGINLKGKAPSARLEESGSFNGMVSHRVRVGSRAEVDDELVSWLKEAYEQA